MKHHDEKKHKMIIPEELKGKACNPIELDPKGYFLIKIEEGRICIAHCNYKDKKGWYENKVESSFSSEDPEEILLWAKKNNLVSLESHYQYLVKEMKHAVKALATNSKYVQE
ncbi:MAG: hypothetical protein HN531_03435 [Opitutae bacterium]|jgi:hypothetical protein|nr:hypothetical protein [Opitutae bacterium]